MYYNQRNIELAKRLRKDMTPWERKLWYKFLRGYSVRFQRQKAIGNYIADFYSAKAKLVIELDGSQHFQDQNIEKDSERTRQIESHNLLVLRIPNNEVFPHFEAVCDFIDAALKERI